jgi:hypothetical protein
MRKHLTDKSETWESQTRPRLLETDWTFEIYKTCYVRPCELSTITRLEPLTAILRLFKNKTYVTRLKCYPDDTKTSRTTSIFIR